jgi:hypothetical protein
MKVRNQVAIRSSSNLFSTITKIIDYIHMSLHLFLEDYNNLHQEGTNFNFNFSFGLCKIYFKKVTTLAIVSKNI